MRGVDRLIFASLNHLLQGEPWAQDRLRLFAGSRVCIEAGPLQLNLRIASGGLFAPADPESAAADVTVTLPVDTPIRLLVDRPALLSAARLAGSADLAESLAFVFRNLRWDVEGDLAGLVGDIPARRLVQAGSQIARQVQVGGRRLAENLAEYASEDSSLLAARRDIAAFAGAVDGLRDDVARLEKRLAALGG